MRYKKLLLALAIVVLGLGATSLRAPKASALSGSDFNPGRIIDDSVFFNKDAMSVNDIQNFLQSKVSSCQTNHAAGSGSQGAQPPWTCLYQYRENTSNLANNIGSPGSNPAGSISAAQIIYNAAQAYSISPKVLLVLIQKESSLITDDWPYPWQYRSATGYGCPDKAPCDAQYYGFYNQVNKAAFQYRRYANYPNEYNIIAGRNNNILLNPNAACGSQTVYVQNQATAGLYNYTPYVPNAAALNNLYGTGDGCSAYGNRNFWRLYSDWFGSTYGVPYQWQIVSQQYSSGGSALTVGEKETVTVVAKNTGSATWSSTGPNPIRIATVDPQNRQSAFYSPAWVSPSRPATLLESSVAPGQNGTFMFAVQAPSAGTYQDRLSLVAENLAWLNDPGMYFTYNVNPSTWSAQLISSNIPASLSLGATANVTVVYKNTSSAIWYKDGNSPVRLGVYDGDASKFYDSSWISSNRPATFNEATVPPGANATFNFVLKAPPVGTSSSIYFQPVVENRAWLFVPASKTISMSNAQGTYSWQLMSQQYAGGDVIIQSGETDTLTVKAKNTGTATWYKDGSYPIRLADVAPQNRASTFYTPSWASPSRPANLVEASVEPGAIGTFSFEAKAGNRGIFEERMSLVAENLAWLNDPGMYFYIDVR